MSNQEQQKPKLECFAMCNTLKEVQKELEDKLSVFRMNNTILWAAMTYDLKTRKFKLYNWEYDFLKYRLDDLDFSKDEIILYQSYLTINHDIKEIYERDPSLEKRIRKIHIALQLESYQVGQLLMDLVEKLDYSSIYEGWNFEDIVKDLKKKYGANEQQVKQYVSAVSREHLYILNRENKLVRYNEAD